ncbi:MAG: hypothetical protein WC284_14795 [Candidimonas sp.]
MSVSIPPWMLSANMPRLRTAISYPHRVYGSFEWELTDEGSPYWNRIYNTNRHTEKSEQKIIDMIGQFDSLGIKDVEFKQMLKFLLTPDRELFVPTNIPLIVNDNVFYCNVIHVDTKELRNSWTWKYKMAILFKHYLHVTAMISTSKTMMTCFHIKHIDRLQSGQTVMFDKDAITIDGIEYV